MSSASGLFSNPVSKAITLASHDTLIKSGNHAYISLHGQFLKAKIALEAEQYVIRFVRVCIYLLYGVRRIVNRLEDVIDKLTRSHSMPRPTSSEPAARGGKLGEKIIIPAAPEALEQEDYPDIPYWQESDWTKHAERQRERGRPFSKLGFLTGKDGSPVTESRIKEFMFHAKQVWNELYRHRLDPSSWTKKTQTMGLFFEHEMKGKFPEFCYGKGNWKVEQFAITKYPDWCRDARESGRLTRACIQSSFSFSAVYILSSKVLGLPSAELVKTSQIKSIAIGRGRETRLVPHLAPKSSTWMKTCWLDLPPSTPQQLLPLLPLRLHKALH